MLNDRFNLCKRSSAFMWCSRRELNHIKEKRELNSKIYLVVNEYDMPINFIVTDELCADCKEAIHLIKNIDAKLVFADRACDTNEILSYLYQQNIKPVILPKRNRLHQHGYRKETIVSSKTLSSSLYN